MNILPAVAEILGPIDFDSDALHRKYIEERDKRLEVGPRVYTHVTEEFARFVEDPFDQGSPHRAAVADEVEFALIGAGFGCLMMGARLRQAGFKSIRLVDSAGDVGGTWYWNRYPGVACDTESYVYMPFLEETGYMPTRKYAGGQEIREHARRIAQQFQLYDNALLRTSVTGLAWDEAARRWIVSTNRGDRFRAQYVAMANGPLNRPKLPSIPGMTKFRGHVFHTCRWDFDYTGGDSTGNLAKLGEKVVGIIGTGSTGVQCIPHLGRWSKQLYVFQRTPSCVDIRVNSPTDPGWATSLSRGWQKARMDNFNAILEGYDEPEDLVNDGWTAVFRKMMGPALKDAERRLGRALTGKERSQLMELSDYINMNRIRRQVEETVKDRATAEALKPWYRQFCKRPTFHDDYFPTFNRPNVKLVDTQGRGVDSVTERGVVVQGREYPLDCLIFATGFEPETSLYTFRAGYDVVGREGVKLSEHWSEGLRMFHGVTTDHFPNCFFLGRTQTGTSLNLALGLTYQTAHIAYMVSQARTRGFEVIEPASEAVAECVEDFRRQARAGLRFWTECTPGAFNNEGNPTGKNLGADSYGGGAKKFFAMLESWRNEGKLSGLKLS